MNRDEAVAAGRGVDERRAQAGLQLVEPSAEGQERGVDGGMGGVVAEEPRLDEVAGGRGLGALGEEQDERRLLLGQARLALAELHRPPRRVELEAAEAVAPRTARATLDQPRRQVG